MKLKKKMINFILFVFFVVVGDSLFKDVDLARQVGYFRILDPDHLGDARASQGATVKSDDKDHPRFPPFFSSFSSSSPPQ